MKILLLYLLLYKLSNKFLKLPFFFLQKIWSIIISFFYLLEYLFLFVLQKNYFYTLIIYKLLVIKQYNNFRKRGFYLKKNNYIKKKKEKKKESKYVKFIKKIYYYRWMYWGFTVVYIQIFLRKMRESKNYIIFLINTRIIRSYNRLKWRIYFHSLFYFLWYNFRLFLYNKRFKKRLKKFIRFINFIIMYIKIKIKVICFIKKKNFIYFFSMILKFIKKKKKWI